jgi:hypothetical protein
MGCSKKVGAASATITDGEVLIALVPRAISDQLAARLDRTLRFIERTDRSLYRTIGAAHG